jgi:hypothetical protein
MHAGWPAVRWTAARPGPIGFVLIYRDEAAAEAVAERFNPSGWMGTRGGDACALTIDGMYAWRWERVANVIVQFNVTPSGETPSELDLSTRVVAALRQAVP